MLHSGCTCYFFVVVYFFNDTATTEIYTYLHPLSLHDALPIYGRRAAMVASVILMGAGSLLVAVLPTYATIGAAAPALLLVARLMQGFSTGGQYGAAATYLSEKIGRASCRERMCQSV